MAGCITPKWLGLFGALGTACLPAGIGVPTPERALPYRSVVAVERTDLSQARAQRAELFDIEAGALPEVRTQDGAQLVWLFYEEDPFSLGLAPGPLVAAEDGAALLAPHHIEQLSSGARDWEALAADLMPEWVLPFVPRVPCHGRQEGRVHEFWAQQAEFVPTSGLHPAMTALVPLDETHALAASAAGKFYRVEWPVGGALQLTPVETATTDYNFSGFRSGDAIYLGGTGARIARVSVAPLLAEPPELRIEEELQLAERGPGLDHAIVSISGDPNGGRDLFFMTLVTEVFHLGPEGVSELRAMDGRMPPFVAQIDKEILARQVAWVAPGQAVAAWFHDGDHRSDTGPILLSTSGERQPLPLPVRSGETLASATSAVLSETAGLFVARSSFAGGGVRAEIFRRRTLVDEWTSFAVVDFAIQTMIPTESTVFASGGFIMFGDWEGAVMRAQRGFRFQEVKEEERCLWLRSNGRQRLLVRMGPKRLLSTGTTGLVEPPQFFTHEE